MYQSLDDALLIRAAVCRPDQVRSWPDLTSTDAAPSWPAWLSQTQRIPGFAAALDYASPDLARRVSAVQAGMVQPRDARRVVLAVMRYLIRATTRATPYGLFAGVAAATNDEYGAVRIGTAHRPVARIRMQWLAGLLTRLETDPTIRPHLRLQANNLLTERDGDLVLEHRASTSPGGAPQHVRVRATDAVRMALAAAAEPTRWAEVSATVAAGCAATSADADRLLTQLVAQHLLLTDLRPSMTATDPLAVLVAALVQLPPTPATFGLEAASSGLPEALRQLAELKRRHDRAISEAHAADCRRQLATTAAAIAAGPALGVDLRLDADVTVPTVVTAEAGRAVAALTRLSVPTATGWASWHRRFLERFGPHALVPVLAAVDPVLGLGYPAGFAGAASAPSLLVTDRDRALVALAQRAALTRQQEIVLDDQLLSALAGAQPETVQSTTELTVRVHAHNLDDMRAGRFTLSVVRVSRNAGTSTGRTLDLLDPDDQQRMAAAYAAGTPPIADGALISQLAAPTRYAISIDVARAPQVLPFLTPVGEFHTADARQIPVEDIAVTADPRRLYLICLSQQRPVQPVPFTAVDPDRQMLPIVRFLAEASSALSAPCHPFDWGPAAHDLPFLPAVRYGRTLLSAARWRLTDDELPGVDASGDTWDCELTGWRAITGCPATVSVGSGDQCLGINLDLPAHRVLLRDYLTRYHIAVLRQAPAGAGWIGDRPHEIVIPLAATGSPVPAPRLSAEVLDVRHHGVLPGGARTYLKVYAGLDQQDRILTDHLADLFDPAHGSGWFQRYHDPDPHLRLRLVGDDLAPVHRWIRRLRQRGLSSRAQLDTDFPETSRFGGSTAYPAAEAVFATDSAAVRAQMIATTGRGGPPRQAMTAASLLDIATAFLDGPVQARRWLTEHAHTQRPAPARSIYDQAVKLADPAHTALTATPSGTAVLTCWQSRTTALAGYRNALHAAGIDAATLLPDLLHLHHTRVAGPDRAAEAVCLHLARAAALSWNARAKSVA